jgi:hypothetical protein
MQHAGFRAGSAPQSRAGASRAAIRPVSEALTTRIQGTSRRLSIRPHRHHLRRPACLGRGQSRTWVE